MTPVQSTFLNLGDHPSTCNRDVCAGLATGSELRERSVAPQRPISSQSRERRGTSPQADMEDLLNHKEIKAK